MDINEVKLCARLCLTTVALCDRAHLSVLKAEAEFHEHETDKFLEEFVEAQIEDEVSVYWNKVYDALIGGDSD